MVDDDVVDSKHQQQRAVTTNAADLRAEEGKDGKGGGGDEK